MAEKFEVKKHTFVPKHEKVSEDEKNKILEKYGIGFKHLPKILANDPAVSELNVKQGDVVKITRKSPTAKQVAVYRGVVNE